MPLILNVGTVWRRGIGFVPRSLYRRYSLRMMQVGPGQSSALQRREYLFPLLVTESWRLAFSLVTHFPLRLQFIGDVRHRREDERWIGLDWIGLRCHQTDRLAETLKLHPVVTKFAYRRGLHHVLRDISPSN